MYEPMYELNVQKYLRSGKTLENLNNEFAIKCNEFEDLVILNYDQIKSTKTDKIVMECRGLILQKDTWNIVCKSFKRFFNYGEALEITDKFSMNGNVYALMKIDGSLISLFSHNNKWIMATRGTINGTGQVNTFNMTFKELFDKTVEQYPNFYDKLDKNLVYIFELTSPENRVVTPYTDRKLNLLTIRDNIEFKEFYYEFIEKWAYALGVDIPRRYSFKSISEIVRMAAELGEMQEGFVCINYDQFENGDFCRVKVKNPAYVAISHIKESSSSSLSALMQLVITGETSEFLSYFPEFKQYTNRLEKEFNHYKTVVENDFEVMKSLKFENRKEFASWATKTIAPNIMFKAYDKKVNSFLDHVNQLIEEKGAKNTAKSFLTTLKVKDIEFGSI